MQLIEGGAETEGIAVNILIKDNKLDLVSKDQIPVDEAAMAVDARNGFLLGKLTIGETPSFIILNQDPRENFETLLDTSESTIFAIHDGRLFRNSLFEVGAAEIAAEKEKQEQLGWTAYSPPPMALPLNYQDTTKWNRWESKYVSGIFIAAAVLDNQQWLTQDGGSRQQVGDLKLFEGGEVRGIRVGIAGTLNFETPWIYTIAGATNVFDKGFEVQQKDSFTLFDYRVDIPLDGKYNLSIGKQKEPISMERIMSMIQLPMQERTSVSDSLMPSRNTGAVLSGTALNQRMSWAGGLFNDFLEDGKSLGNSATQLVGRVTWLPYVSEDDSNLVHLGFGLRYSDAKEGLGYLTEPEFNKAPVYVDTTVNDMPFAADSSMLYNFEASWRKGPYWLAAEYVRNSIDAAALGDPTLGGYHVTASWILSGEMREYRNRAGIFGPVPVAKTVYQGGWGAWELGFRYSDLDLTDGLIDGGEMDILSLGVSWWLTPTFNVNMNYRYITLDRFGVVGNSSGIMTRVLLLLE